MSEIYMVRHGQASFGRENYDVLSETGIVQARVLGDFLAASGLQFDAVYTWKLARQVGTAQGIVDAYRGRGIAIPDWRFKPALSEYGTTSVLTSYVPDVVKENPALRHDVEHIYTDKKSFQRVFEAVIIRWVTGEHPKAGVEPWNEFSSRVNEGVREIMVENGRGKRLLFVTSGGPIAAVLQQTLSISAETAIRLSWQVANTSVSKFMYNDERMTLAGFNSLAHLEMKDRELVTYR